MARSHLIIFVLLTAFALTGQAALAQEPPAGPTMPAPAAPPEVFGERVLAYLLAHPEVIVEAVQIYRQRQEAARAETAKGVIADRADEIFRDPAAPSAGKAAGTSRQLGSSTTTVGAAVLSRRWSTRSSADRRLRLVYKECPILGPGSETAARVALAARRQDRTRKYMRH